MNKKRISFICPYCDLKQYANLEERQNVIYCDIDEGGCDQPVVLDLRLIPDVTIYKMEKVEKPYTIKAEIKDPQPA